MLPVARSLRRFFADDPYCKDSRGFGPCWEQSLFEDNAEFAYGFLRAQDAIQKELLIHLQSMKKDGIAVEAVDNYLESYQDSSKSRDVTDQLIQALEQVPANEDVELFYKIKNS